MAEGFLYNMIEKLSGYLGSMAVDTWNVKDDVEKLVDNMSEIKAVILDAEEQKQGTNNHQVRLWLEKLKVALDDADDLLDDFSTEDKRRKVMTKDKKAKQLRLFFSSPNFSFKMARKIKDLRKTIEDLNVGSKTFNFTKCSPPEQRVLRQREFHSLIHEEKVIGREEEKEELIKLLMNTDSNEKENVSVISIIGIGGLGKTALAQLVYNDKAVQNHFEFKKWVWVADDSDVRGFDVKGVAAKILDSKTGDIGMDQVQLELRKKVERKRYLLVLDDIWNEDRELWLQLMTLLVDGAKGSKIIVTTRSETVAKITGTSSLFRLKGLDKEKSWRLFSQLAFKDGKEPENQNLVSIGKKIAEKCAGVPLAIRSIGSLMYSKESEKDWSNFQEKDLVKIDEQCVNNVFQLIKLSYDHLPFHLKKCFAFCSLFPKDYDFERKTLIRLWVAQGFVHSSDESASLEDIGEEYFMTLAHRSFFQDFKKDMFGDISSFKMHDLLHDLATSISENDHVMVKKKGQHIDKRVRHVSFGFALDSSWQVPSSLLEAKKLRTFLLPEHRFRLFLSASLEESACNSIMSCSEQYRVMDLNYLNSREIPSCIGMLKHLRYLDLSHSKQIEELPMSITELINLETLLLNGCSELRELPKDLWKMISLRHLELDKCNKLTCMPRGIGQLTNLQTLTQFVLDTTSKDSAGASEISELNNLRRKLGIKGLECLRRSPTEAKDMNLMGKSHLQWLELTWCEQIDGDGNDMEKDDIILEGLLPHPNIKFLQVSGFGGMTLFSGSSLVSSFTHLNKLSLNGCTRLQYLPPFDVKRFLLSELPCLEWIVNNNSNGSSSTFSPSLTEISLVALDNLKGWCRCNEEEIQRGCCHQLNSLEELWISSCPNLISIPRLTNIREIVLQNVREKTLQQAVSHSKVEFLSITRIDGLKSLSGVLQHLTILNILYIRDCEELDPCNDEDGCYSMQWKELKNLKQLQFYKIPKMEYLPEGLQHVTTLHTLRIQNCDNLTSIPEWVTSLQVLVIRDCPKLTSLPEGVQVK